MSRTRACGKASAATPSMRYRGVFTRSVQKSRASNSRLNMRTNCASGRPRIWRLRDQGAAEILEHINKDTTEIAQLELTLNELIPGLEQARKSDAASTARCGRPRCARGLAAAVGRLHLQV